MLWTHFDEFQRNSSDWLQNPFGQLNSEDIEKDMKKFKQGIGKLKMNIHNLTTEDKDRVLEAYEQKYEESYSFIFLINYRFLNLDIRALRVICQLLLLWEIKTYKQDIGRRYLRFYS